MSGALLINSVLISSTWSDYFSSFTVLFPMGSAFSQTGNSDYLRIYLPNESSHVFWGHANTSTQPSLSDSPIYHQLDVDGLHADEVKDLFAQEIVNTGYWAIEGFTVQPDLTYYQSYDPATLTDSTNADTAWTIAQKVSVGQAGTAFKIGVYIHLINGSSDLYVGLYDISGNLLTSNNIAIPSGAPGWYDVTISQAVSVADYFVAWAYSGFNGSLVVAYNTSGGVSGSSKINFSGGVSGFPPANLAGFADSTLEFGSRIAVG